MRIIICDDQALVREGLEMLIGLEEDIDVVATASNGNEAVELVEKYQPELILMDLKMPVMNGIEATRMLHKSVPETAVLALTMYEDDQYFFEMLKAGASGYIPKRAAPDELVVAIRTVSRSEVYLYPSLAARLVQDFVDRKDIVIDTLSDSLTAREREVLVLIAEGLTNPEIALELGISIKTVDRHRENILMKLDMHSRVALVKYAIKKGLIDLD